MKALMEIIEELKDGGKPTYDELYYTVLALDFLSGMDGNDLRDFRPKETDSIRGQLAQNVIERNFQRWKRALSIDPKTYCGKDVPDNPNYQAMRKASLALLNKIIGKQND